jgi:hypothetical protein
LVVLDVEHNALNETLEVEDNNQVDVESYQLLVVVDHTYVVEVEVVPWLLVYDYLVEHHMFHVVVEQKEDKLNRHLLMMNHLLMMLFCTENRQHLVGVHQRMHLEL